MWDILREFLFLLVVFVSNVIQAITGFAGTMLAMPASMLLLGVNEAKASLNLIAFLTCLWITVRNYKQINKKEFLKITFFMIIGMIAGMLIFQVVSLSILLPIYAFLIILIALKNFFIHKKIPLPQTALCAVLLFAGMIHGMFVSGGALLVIYAATVLRDKTQFRATLSPVWVVLNGIMLTSHIYSGFFTSRVLLLCAASLVPVIGSVFLGNYLHKKIGQSVFFKITYILLLISGLLLLLG